MAPQIFKRIVLNLVLGLYVLESCSIMALYLKSPCPNVFTYQVDHQTDHIFGLIEIPNLPMGRVAKLNVDLSVGAQLPASIVGSLNLIKSREATYDDVYQGLPVQYRVNFPVQNILPTVHRIALNGQTICSGYRAQGRIITNINLEHTLYSQLQSLGITQNHDPPHLQDSEEFDSLQTRFQQPPIRPQPKQPQPPPQWNFDVQPKVTESRPAVGSFARPHPVRTTVAPITTSSSSCGKPITSLLKQLSINGELVDRGQFPWIVPLFDRTQPQNPQYICGSTIITRQHLLTAAHCVFDADDIMAPGRILAVPGMYNIDNFFEDNAQFADVAAVLPHEDFMPEEDISDADLAVLRLKVPLEFSKYVVPICLWHGENDVTRIFGQQGFVAGWGWTEQGPSALPTFIKTTVINRRQCGFNLARVFSSHARIFCGDGQGSTPCNGDSGSGLILKRGNQYYLRGIVSKGQLDPHTLKCDATKYAIYTDIAPFRFWLKNAISN